jgi:uncharacterized OB-fold protein
MSDPIPVPVPNLDNQGFWDGCRHHELRLQRCTACGAVRHHPRPMCPQCNCFEYEWMRASGHGTLYTFTIVHGPTLPVFQAQAPYNVAVIQFDEGPFIVSNVVGCSREHLHIGMRVEVVFEDIDDTTTLPRFRPLA